MHQGGSLAPRGDRLIGGAVLGGEAVTEIGAGEGVDALVLHGSPRVLLLGSEVIGEVGEGAGRVAGDCAGSGPLAWE